jgi:hypothetical protein
VESVRGDIGHSLRGRRWRCGNKRIAESAGGERIERSEIMLSVRIVSGLKILKPAHALKYRPDLMRPKAGYAGGHDGAARHDGIIGHSGGPPEFNIEAGNARCA